MRKTLLTATALGALALAPAAHATLIASFSQNQSATPTITATDNGVTTNITATSASTSITAGNGAIIGNALFSLNATSVTPAVTLGSQIIQRYNGSFCFTSGPGCTGVNILSGTFTDAAFGANGGPGLVVNVNSPPDTLNLTSALIPASELVAPSTFGLTFANLTPGLHLNGTTIGAFTADFSGTISASSAVAEPATIAVLGMGVLGIGMLHRRRKPLDGFAT